jgi:hypothetical protein
VHLDYNSTMLGRFIGHATLEEREGLAMVLQSRN